MMYPIGSPPALRSVTKSGTAPPALRTVKFSCCSVPGALRIVGVGESASPAAMAGPVKAPPARVPAIVSVSARLLRGWIDMKGDLLGHLLGGKTLAERPRHAQRPSRRVAG